MPFYKSIRIRATDTLFSRYIRLRDKECSFKHKCYGHQTFDELQCCHFHSRRKENVRFDPENADAGCVKCHYFIDQTAEGQRWLKEFKKKQLGERAYDLLELRSSISTKKDDVSTITYVKGLIASLPPAQVSH